MMIFDKCHTITFSKSCNVVNVKGTIDENILARVYEVKHLGVVFESKLNLFRHVQTIVQQAYCNLGLITRLGKECSCYL